MAIETDLHWTCTFARSNLRRAKTLPRFLRFLDSFQPLTENRILSEKSKRKKSNKKDSQLVVRINKDERDQFIDICDEMDTSAAREVRRFIRDFLKKNPIDE